MADVTVTFTQVLQSEELIQMEIVLQDSLMEDKGIVEIQVDHCGNHGQVPLELARAIGLWLIISAQSH